MSLLVPITVTIIVPVSLRLTSCVNPTVCITRDYGVYFLIIVVFFIFLLDTDGLKCWFNGSTTALEVPPRSERSGSTECFSFSLNKDTKRGS